MPTIMSQDELYANFVDAWWPKTLVIERKRSGAVEVQLTEKKNKLFGKVESVWR